MANIGLPKFSLIFKGLASSIIERGSKGVAVLIIKDDTDKTFTFAEYTSTEDLTTTEKLKYTSTNLQYINDCLEGTPLKLIVARMDATDGVLADLLTAIKGKTSRNCWIGIAEATTTETDALVTFIKSENTTNKKCYKAFTFKATAPDNEHVVNLTNPSFTLASTGISITGEKTVAFFLGLYAGLPLTMSAIGKILSKFSYVEEPANIETAIDNGELVCINDEGKVKVARSVTSLKTTTSIITDDFKYVVNIEAMDMIYSDIYNTWHNDYSGKFKNSPDNQALFFGAVNDYFRLIAESEILDRNYDNLSSVDIQAQRIANYPKFTKAVVDKWKDDYVKEMTVGTQVFGKANIKILNAMEDITFVMNI